MVTEINFDAHYTVDGYRGIAFYLIGYAEKQEPILGLFVDQWGSTFEDETGEYETVTDYDHTFKRLWLATIEYLLSNLPILLPLMRIVTVLNVDKSVAVITVR